MLPFLTFQPNRTMTMNSATQTHINHVVDWVHGQANCQPTITKSSFASLLVLVEEYKRLQTAHDGHKAVDVQAISPTKSDTLENGCNGVMLRDCFAAKAMAALLFQSGPYGEDQKPKCREDVFTAEKIAEYAYAQADAMLAIRALLHTTGDRNLTDKQS